MDNRGIVLILLTFWCATDHVYASHFRGGVIMVKPKLGGGTKEVKNE